MDSEKNWKKTGQIKLGHLRHGLENPVLRIGVPIDMS